MGETMPIEKVLIGVVVKSVGVVIGGKALFGGRLVNPINGGELVVKEAGVGRGF